MSDSGWTVGTLREFLQKQMDDQRVLLDERYATQTKALDAAFVAAEKAVTTALSSAEKAVTKSEDAYRSKFADVNEFRKTLSDQAAGFLSRDAAEARFEALAEKLDALATRLDKSEGRGSGLNAGWVYLLAAIGALGTIFTIYVIVKGG